MTDASDISHFRRQARLRDGTPVVIRAIRPNDQDKVLAAFRKLEPRSIYTRFFAYRKELSADELERLGGADFVNVVVLVVALGDGADEVLIGGGSYHARTAEGGAQAAELAFTIEEDYQGQGLCTTLLALLTEIARSRGIARFEAEVLASNTPMLSVFQHSGLPMTRTSQDGVVHVVLGLADQGASRPVPREAGMA